MLFIYLFIFNIFKYVQICYLFGAIKHCSLNYLKILCRHLYKSVRTNHVF